MNPDSPVLSIRHRVSEEGFAIVPESVSKSEVEALQQAVAIVIDPVVARRRDGVFALRNLLEVSREVRSLSESMAIRDLVEPILGKGCFPVRGILFDKIPGANWKVPFHQDVTIAVKEKLEAEGFGPWSIKAGVIHTQPPVSVLESMLSVRIHLDDCHQQNGALRVIPGSHRSGRISVDAIDSLREQMGEQVCAVGAGGVLLMKPLLLHASSSSLAVEHRRIVHIDFAVNPLPHMLRWSYDPSRFASVSSA